MDEEDDDLRFDDETLTSTSAIGTSELHVRGFRDFTVGSQGFFLVPDTGVSIYVPRVAVAPSDLYSELVDMLTSSVSTSERNAV